MTAIITFKSETGLNVHRRTNVIAILTTSYAIKLIQSSNRMESFEKCDVENIFLENLGK